MRYEIEHPTVLGQQTLVEQLWVPLPNADGDGTRAFELLDVYPEGYQVLDIGEANQAVYWGGVPDLCQETDCRFGIRFQVTLERPMYAIPWNAEVSYDAESELYRTYTSPQRGIESDDPALRELARNIVGGETNVYKRVLRLQAWVGQNVLYPDLGAVYPDDALLCIDAGLGDCAGQSKVFVALCRALGIPARTVSGLLPFRHGIGPLDEFGPRAAWFERNLSVHVWCEVYFPGLGWVQVEPDTPGYGIDRERLITRRGPFALQDGLCRQATYFHLPLAVRGDWCGQSVGWEASIDAQLLQ
jgi:transglutaminase-like putative cysteine protease